MNLLYRIIIIFAVGEQVGLLIKPFDIHIMKKDVYAIRLKENWQTERMWNFWGCTFECLPVADIEPGAKVKVQVDFKDIILQDNEEDGTLTGDVRLSYIRETIITSPCHRTGGRIFLLIPMMYGIMVIM